MTATISPEPPPWTRIFERVKTQIPGCPDPVIRQEFWSVMIDLTQDTNIWLEEIPITIMPDIVSYPLTITDGKAYRLMIVYNNNPNSDPGTKYRWADQGITMRVPGTVLLYNKPNEIKNWVAVVAKTVSNPRTISLVPPVQSNYPEVPDWIVDYCNDVIYYGVMGYLQRMPTKPWLNPDAAKMNYSIYSSQKAAVRVNQLRANVFNAQTWSFPQSFRTITMKGWA